MRLMTSVGLALALGAGLVLVAVELNSARREPEGHEAPIAVAISRGTALLLDGASRPAAHETSNGISQRKLACRDVVRMAGFSFGFVCGEQPRVAASLIRG